MQIFAAHNNYSRFSSHACISDIRESNVNQILELNIGLSVRERFFLAGSSINLVQSRSIDSLRVSEKNERDSHQFAHIAAYF
jgi:hypothetical protein